MSFDAVIHVILRWFTYLNVFLNGKIQEEDNVIMNTGNWSAGYNIGDLMNMPSLLSPPAFPKHGVDVIVDAARKIATLNPTTFIGIYHHVYNRSCPIPYVPKVIWAIEKYGRSKYRVDSASLSLVRKESTLLVHIRSGDYGVISDSYKSQIMNLSLSFDTICLIGGVHADQRYAPENVSKANLNRDIHYVKTTLEELGKEVHARSTKLADDDLYLMHSAANLLVHKGGFSALGGLACRGRVFFADEATAYTSNPEYFNQITHPAAIDEHSGKLVSLGRSDFLNCCSNDGWLCNGTNRIRFGPCCL
jgi:hypothetical protein